MTGQQHVAMLDPCALPLDCGKPKYRALAVKGRRVISSVLTVNIGEE